MMGMGELPLSLSPICLLWPGLSIPENSGAVKWCREFGYDFYGSGCECCARWIFDVQVLGAVLLRHPCMLVHR